MLKKLFVHIRGFEKDAIKAPVFIAVAVRSARRGRMGEVA